ncbi:unnamed protein product [Acanthoscelides obtectus]|uniref:Uncharacterized protein n=1 Tax=Acanthoscelides obtectus TaxID=200917 RepID=A0A9P0Q6G0_ACAOB|nr:unnamed protein product [Acanthoscelides obtectus]CAK1675719.1 hypothetical protein AOBTE_LOCUS30387 [Acanthoscelides obtectus]
MEKFGSSHNLRMNPLKINMLVYAKRTKKNTLKRDTDIHLKGFDQHQFDSLDPPMFEYPSYAGRFYN